ncbi:MAG: uracil-DNA glycosylase family protein [Candidatus Syntrophosphaera sp.]
MQKEQDWELQSHPYEPYIPENAAALILGSAPPWRFCVREPKPLKALDVDYYYGSHNRGYNLLWELLFRVFEPSGLEELDGIRKLQNPRPQRSKLQIQFFRVFLRSHSLGMADILLKFSRRDRSAADGKLKALEFTSLLGILEKHPGIRSIFCTSQNRVFLWLEHYLALNGVKMESGAGKTLFFTLPALPGTDHSPRRINVLVLPSPSPVGRIRFPSHQAFVAHLTEVYARMFGAERDSHPGI